MDFYMDEDTLDNKQILWQEQQLHSCRYMHLSSYTSPKIRRRQSS